jgi:hypothetical protein
VATKKKEDFDSIHSCQIFNPNAICLAITDPWEYIGEFCTVA